MHSKTFIVTNAQNAPFICIKQTPIKFRLLTQAINSFTYQVKRSGFSIRQFMTCQNKSCQNGLISLCINDCQVLFIYWKQQVRPILAPNVVLLSTVITYSD